LTALINDLAGVSHDFILVLDDYHFIQSEAVHSGVAFLLEHLPPRMHLVIGTRVNPPLPLAHLRGRGTLVEIRADDLRFTREETKSLLQALESPQLSPSDLKALHSRTEGWVVGLKMAVLSLKGEKDIPRFIADFTGSQRYIMDYLIEEVLQRQPLEVQEFLLQTSILDNMNGALCDAVTGGSSGAEMLLNLEKANLFVVLLDDRREWYRYTIFSPSFCATAWVQVGKRISEPAASASQPVVRKLESPRRRHQPCSGRPGLAESDDADLKARDKYPQVDNLHAVQLAAANTRTGATH